MCLLIMSVPVDQVCTGRGVTVLEKETGDLVFLFISFSANQ